MNRNDLRRVDMNLLVIFETLMFEKPDPRRREIVPRPACGQRGAGAVAGICLTIRCWCETAVAWSRRRAPW
jgi:hypothetical protein